MTQLRVHSGAALRVVPARPPDARVQLEQVTSLPLRHPQTPDGRADTTWPFPMTLTGP